jgi:hypothetical protein
MLGYCGINCEACPAFQGTVTTNRSLLERACAEYSKGATSVVDWVCVGCTPPNQPFLAAYCARCSIRTCAIEQGVANCAACASYESCDKLRRFMETESEDVLQRMAWLRQRFLADCSAGGGAS